LKLVVDASAAVEIAMDRGKSASFGDQVTAASLVLAPDLIVAEIVNSIWKYHNFHGLSIADCDRAVERSIGLIDEIVPSLQIHREAFLLARSVRKPAYDMFYLALARQRAACLLSADSALRKEAERQGIQVVS
jgi:predicted nucleic acid-binding protein